MLQLRFQFWPCSSAQGKAEVLSTSPHPQSCPLKRASPWSTYQQRKMSVNVSAVVKRANIIQYIIHLTCERKTWSTRPWLPSPRQRTQRRPSPPSPYSLIQVQFHYTPSTLGAAVVRGKTSSKTLGELLDFTQVSYTLGQRAGEGAQACQTGHKFKREEPQRREAKTGDPRIDTLSCFQSLDENPLRRIRRLGSAWITEQKPFTKTTKLLT